MSSHEKAGQSVSDKMDDSDKDYSRASRLLSYLMRYRIRLLTGIFFALFASISNIFSITMFIPIFNALGDSDKVVVFQIGKSELEKYDRIENGEELPVHEELAAYWAHIRHEINEFIAPYSPKEVIFIISGSILPLYLLKLISVTLTIYLVGTAGLLAVRDMRDELYQKMNQLGMDYFAHERTGLIMSRIINDAEVIGKSISMEFSTAIINVFYIITSLMLLTAISWDMLIITFLVAPITSIPIGKLAKKIRRVTMAQQEWLGRMGGHVQEVISGIRVIRAFSMERFEKTRFKKINEEMYRNTYEVHYNHQVGPAVTEFIATIIILGFLSWGAYRISDGHMDRGMFFAFFFTLIFVMRPLKQVNVMVNLFQTALGAADRVFEVLDREGQIIDPEDAPEFNTVQKEIAFKNVSFRYPGESRYALKNINLVAPRGKTLSIVGSSGAGKSTLMDLLPRFYEPNSGTVEIDGEDIKKWKVRSLRTRIGIVTQNIFLFNATLRENIAYGRNDVAFSRIEEVARAANAHEFIEKLPLGYETPVGERGVMLSGGQRQRIAIARALLHNPPILIFDEATSSLDNESEMLIQEAMETLRKGRTVFMIAHRLSTVYKSDEIIVMDDGEIAERGNHKTLLENSKIYRKLYEMQFTEQG